MKRGRPNKRNKMHESILNVFQSVNAPLTISSVARLVSDREGERISWNTIRKYMYEMVETNRIEAVMLPHSKEDGKEGLTVYMLKK